MKHIKKFIGSDNDETVYDKIAPYFAAFIVAVICFVFKMFGV